MLGSYSAFNHLLIAFLGSLALVARAQNVTWQTTPFNPPAFPLAVKSPYASTWAQGGTTEFANQWPYFGTAGILGWTCYVKVDNTTFTVLGVPSVRANNVTTQTQTEFTVTRSIVTSRAGPVDLTVTFLSPLDYTDYVRLSLPFSYFSVSAVSNDGQSHTVSVYTDISGEWVNGDTSQAAQWSTTTDSGVVLHKMYLQTPNEFTENEQRAQWGTAYIAANRTDGTTWQTGQDTTLRSLFLSKGALDNTQDTAFRGISDKWPVMAIAQSLGSVTAEAQVVTFVLGHTRNPAVRYFTATGQEDRSLYFLSKYTTEEDAVRFAVADYRNARVAASQFDTKVQTDAEKISPDYASVVALGTRQAFASMELTLSGTGSNANLQDIKLFTKDTAMDQGSSMNGVLSTVDSLYSIMPMLIYTNPNLGNYGLASLLEYAPLFAQQFATHDLGLRYPVVTSHVDQMRSPVDATSSMLIMTAAFMRYTGNAGLAAKHYYTLKKWADYLVKNALVHQSQLTGDWFVSTPAANQTNIALKGLIALRSMVEIQNAVGMSNESSTYSDAASSGLEQWIQLSNSGTKYTYESGSQPILLHALYADKILGLNFVPESVYAQQRAQFASSMRQFGVPLTSASTVSSTTWQYFTIAALTASNVNATAFTSIKNFAIRPQGQVKVGVPADVYDVESGDAVQGYAARGNVGGAYAILALGTPVQQITPVAASPSPANPTATVPSATGSSNSAGKVSVQGVHIFAALFTVVPCLVTLLVL